MGNHKEDARQWERKGGRPIPQGDSRFIATKAAWGFARRLLKWGVVESEGVNQYPNHLRSSLGLNIDTCRWMGA